MPWCCFQGSMVALAPQTSQARSLFHSLRKLLVRASTLPLSHTTHTPLTHTHTHTHTHICFPAATAIALHYPCVCVCE
jgi:hypothetical protein